MSDYPQTAQQWLPDHDQPQNPISLLRQLRCYIERGVEIENSERFVADQLPPLTIDHKIANLDNNNRPERLSEVWRAISTMIPPPYDTQDRVAETIRLDKITDLRRARATGAQT